MKCINHGATPRAGRMTRRKFVALSTAAGATLLLGGCASGTQGAAETDKDDMDNATISDPAQQEQAPQPSAAEQLLASMALEQKVAQLFLVTPEVLTGVADVTAAGEITQNALAETPVGGLIYFSQNITGADQLKEMLANTVGFSQSAGAGIPVFTAVDEEGGSLVARVANSGYFDVETFPDMAQIGATGDTSQAANVGSVIGGYLHDIGFSLDFAPDADVLTNPDNQVIGQRSFSSDPNVVSEMVAAEIPTMVATGVLPCAKHFPGHGDTAGDSHTGAAETERTLDDMNACEFLPFAAAAQAGVPFIMIGHITAPNAIVEDEQSAAATGAAAGDVLPATLSYKAITQILREQLGFSGVVISDSMRMGAISQFYDETDASVRFLLAGGDMILMPDDLGATYQGVLDAVSAGTLTEDRIDESVMRIIAAKQLAGLVAH